MYGYISQLRLAFAVTAAPYGQVPYMIYKGKKYGQSIPIATFIARKLGKLKFRGAYRYCKSCCTHLTVSIIP